MVPRGSTWWFCPAAFSDDRTKRGAEVERQTCQLARNRYHREQERAGCSAQLQGQQGRTAIRRDCLESGGRVQRRHTISPLWLSVSCSSSSWVSDGFVSRDRGRKRARAGPLVSDCFPFSGALFGALYCPFSSLERSTEYSRSTSGCVATGTHGFILSIDRSHLQNTPGFRSATRRHADTRSML